MIKLTLSMVYAKIYAIYKIKFYHEAKNDGGDLNDRSQNDRYKSQTGY